VSFHSIFLYFLADQGFLLNIDRAVAPPLFLLVKVDVLGRRLRLLKRRLLVNARPDAGRERLRV